MRQTVIASFLAALTLAQPGSATRTTSQSGEQELAKLVGDRRAGTPVDCITQSDMDRVQVIDGTAIVYGSGTRLFVNRPVSPAALRDDDVLVTAVTGGQLCRIDTVRLLDRNTSMLRGFVVLGSFVPYARPR